MSFNNFFPAFYTGTKTNCKDQEKESRGTRLNSNESQQRSHHLINTSESTQTIYRTQAESPISITRRKEGRKERKRERRRRRTCLLGKRSPASMTVLLDVIYEDLVFFRRPRTFLQPLFLAAWRSSHSPLSQIPLKPETLTPQIFYTKDELKKTEISRSVQSNHGRSNK